MNIRPLAALCTLVVALAACMGDQVTNVRSTTERGILPTQRPLLSTNCRTESKAAIPYTGPALETALESIAYNCQLEMCGNNAVPVNLGFVLDGDNATYNDQITFKCQNVFTGAIQKDSVWGSDQPCWNCVYGCATNCPAGHTCYPITGTRGVDCQAFTCEAGWQITAPSTYGQPPTCTRQVCDEVLSVTVSGPGEIQPGGQCTWQATPHGGSGGPYTITWYVSSQVVGQGPYYTGGKPSGVSGPNFSLKAEVFDGQNSTYTLHPVTETSSAPMCMS